MLKTLLRNWADHPWLKRHIHDLRGDFQRLLLLAVFAGITMLALNHLSWGGTPGDLLSALAFVLITIILMMHILRRVLLPFVQMGTLVHKAYQDPLASAIIFAAVILFKSVLIISFVLLFIAPGHASSLPGGLPANAYRNLPILLTEQQRFWPDHPAPSVLAAQVEQETCPSLRSVQCWSERAELKTSREHGIGLGQITRTARFDTLSALKRQYGALLANWSWAAPYNPVLQARALVLQDKQCYSPLRGIANNRERLAMSLNCYNAGPGMLAISRSRCAAQSGCKPDRWFGHVELAAGPSRAAGYGKRSFYAISREYVSNIMIKRRARYQFLDAQSASV
jgi:hypothetical protein